MSLFQFYLYIAGSLHVSGPQPHLQETSHSCSHNHWFSVCTALAVCSVCCVVYILPDLYMFRAHSPIFRRLHTAVHTTIGSVSVLLWPCALYVVSFIYCRISTCFGPTAPSSGDFTQLFTQPLVQCLYCSGRVLCMLCRLYIAGSLHVSGPQPHLQETSHSCSHNHWFSVCIALAVCSVCCVVYILPDLYMFRAHSPIFRRLHTAVHTTIGSVSVLLWPCALYVVSFIYCRISTCFGPTAPSSGDFTQLFTQPLVQCLYCSGRVLCMLCRLYIA